MEFQLSEHKKTERQIWVYVCIQKSYLLIAHLVIVGCFIADRAAHEAGDADDADGSEESSELRE